MKISPTAKKWIVSSIVSFLAAFCFVLVAQIDSLTVESFRNGAVVGLIFSAIRAGIKASAEKFLHWYNSEKSQ